MIRRSWRHLDQLRWEGPTNCKKCLTGAGPDSIRGGEWGWGLSAAHELIVDSSSFCPSGSAASLAWADEGGLEQSFNKALSFIYMRGLF